MCKNERVGIDGVLYSLRTLFAGYGYKEYKMNKFEEYDLYVKNKDFLISDNVITFTDTNGKLLALKPDVTLSIVKNTKPQTGVQKLFYGERVYRVSSKNNGFREIEQVGLECIGDLDDYNVAEVLTLAVESLKRISDKFVLDVSPVRLTYAFVEALNLAHDTKKSTYKCINEKNTHELKFILSNAGVAETALQTLVSLVELYGTVDEVLCKLKRTFQGTELEGDVVEFERVFGYLPEEIKGAIHIDCSFCENVKYYNGITFRGYIENAPKAILSGGRYDGLLKRMGKNCGAIGFAIYPDEFDRLFTVKREYDVDTVVLYGESTDRALLLKRMQALFAEGKTATALKELPEGMTYREKIQL